MNISTIARSGVQSYSRKRKRQSLDFPRIAAAARANALSVCQQLLPSGRRSGNEYVALNPRRADTKPGSFKVAVSGQHAGCWCDFATGDSGGLRIAANPQPRGKTLPPTSTTPVLISASPSPRARAGTWWAAAGCSSCPMTPSAQRAMRRCSCSRAAHRRTRAVEPWSSGREQSELWLLGTNAFSSSALLPSQDRFLNSWGKKAVGFTSMATHRPARPRL